MLPVFPTRGDDELDPHRVQSVLVAMMFDPEYAGRVRGDVAMPTLTMRERALLRTVDPRALRTDRYRVARAIATLLDEYPVTASVLGASVFERFFTTDAFRATLDHGRMAIAFGGWIGERAHGVGRLEAAMATVRRAAPIVGAGIHTPPRMRALVVPAGTLAYHGRVRTRMGADVAAAIARRDLARTERPPQRGTEHLLVERRDDGSIDLGTGSEALVRLLAFAEQPHPRAVLEAEAIRRGAEPHEAGEILDDLLAQGLLTEAT